MFCVARSYHHPVPHKHHRQAEMATEASVKLPSIEVTIKAAGSKDNDQKINDKNITRATSFLSRLQLGSLEQQRKPGDVWGGTANKSLRPLGTQTIHLLYTCSTTIHEVVGIQTCSYSIVLISNDL